MDPKRIGECRQEIQGVKNRRIKSLHLKNIKTIIRRKEKVRGVQKQKGQIRR